MKFLQILAATSSLLFSIAVASPTAHPRLRRSKLPAVKDSYIVVLKDNTSKEASLQRLESLVLPFDSESVKEVGKKWSVINGYSARLSGKALEHVLNDPDVDYVEENSMVKLDTSKFVSGQAAASTQNDIEARAEGGAGTDIIVIDTGIRTTHTSFGSRAIWGAVFGGYPQADGNGHGTAVASVAGGSGLGPATQARLIAVKVLADDGSGTLDDVVSGVDYAVTSFQSTSRPTIAILAIAFAGTGSTAFDSVVRNAITNGIHFVVAAGGQNIDAGTTTPSRVAEAVTVGAINSSRAKASTSSFGSVLDVWFLGVNVRAAWNTGNTAIVSASATSLSAAGVAGILSVAIGRYGNKTPALLQADLKTNARPDVTGAPTGTTNLRAVVW